VSVGTTFGGAAVIRGDLTPECAAAGTAVLEALGKKAGPEDDRTEKQRFQTALGGHTRTAKHTETRLSASAWPPPPRDRRRTPR
jgi:hypothetical protein